MKVSLNQIKQFIDFELPPVDELVDRINQQLGGVEEVIDLAGKYKDARIVRVVSAEKHPNADRLNVTKIDDGGVTENIERDENGLIQVVCGAPNVHADMWAVWLPPESTVPASYDDAEPFVLGARELRGVMSQGMLAAGDELAINHDHDGIIEIDQNEWRPYDVAIEPGVSFAKAYGLDDTIIDIENKMFTHRPDLFGQLGVAREIAGILGHKFTSPSWYLDVPEFDAGSGFDLEVFNEAGEKVPRVMFAALKNIDIKPSPLWLQTALVAMGSKSINNIVDVTNYVMLLTAQPTHAYDYDRLRGARIGARMARGGEKIKLLNDKTYELTSDDIVIADAEGPVGLGGIMGGADSEVDEHTKNIVLEVATFDMYAVRKSAMRHGVFTDALTRFNKGQSPLQNSHVMNVLLASIKDVSSAEQASDVFDRVADELQQKNSLFGEIAITTQFINERLGLKLTSFDIANLLRRVNFAIIADDDNENNLHVTAPFWRTDIELPEDIVEEVGRLYGFDKLPRELPHRSIAPAPKNQHRVTNEILRDTFKQFGANEVLTYSFVHEKVLQNADQNPERAFKLSNALSPDLQYYRLTVLPSLLDKVHMNIRAGFDEFVIYEIGKGHQKDQIDSDSLPIEATMCDAVYASKKAKPGAAFYEIRRYADAIAAAFTSEFVYEPITQPHDDPYTAPFELGRSARVKTKDGVFVGIIGELKNSVVKNFKLPDYTAAMSLDFAALAKLQKAARTIYTPLSRFPSVHQDVSLKVAKDVAFSDVTALITATANDAPYRIDIAPLAIYSGDDETKTLTYRITVTSYETTLKEAEVSQLVEQMASRAATTFAAVRV